MALGAGVLGALRARVAAIEASSPHAGRVLSLGDPRVDLRLPGGGLPRGRWHELAGEGLEGETAAAVAGFAARLAVGLCAVCDGAGGDEAGRGEGQPGETVWVARRDDLYAPGAAGLGLDPARLLFVAVRRDADALAAMEDALRAPGVAAVVGEVARLDLTAGRRLQLACERTGATGLILRRREALRAGRDGVASAAQSELGQNGAGPETAEASAASTRWRIAPSPSAPEQAGFIGLGPPRWRVRLARCRGGRTGDWILEACDGKMPVRVVAELADHDLEATPSGRLAAG
jgi:protein ImuA